MGWHCGCKFKRAYDPSLEEIWTKRREINLGRGGGRGLARRASESESAGNCPAYARRIGGIAKGSGRRTPANDGFRRGALHGIAVDAFRTLLPPERTRQARAAHPLSSSDIGSKTGIASRLSNSDRRRNWRDHGRVSSRGENSAGTGLRLRGYQALPRILGARIS